MDFIIGFVVLCIVLFLLFLMCMGLFVIWGLMTGFKGSDKRKAAHQEKLRTEVFSGDRATVPYEWSNFQSSSRADVVKLADEQGYRLVSSSDEKGRSAMYFEKRDDSPPSSGKASDPRPDSGWLS